MNLYICISKLLIYSFCILTMALYHLRSYYVVIFLRLVKFSVKSHLEIRLKRTEEHVSDD